MRTSRIFALGSCLSLLILLSVSLALAAVERPTLGTPSASKLGLKIDSGPFVLSMAGDTTWIQCHLDGSYCPGDPNQGHGGEATGAPDASETWCFEWGEHDDCGTIPPWTGNCFSHRDVRSMPSPLDINYWHIDSYRTDQRVYCGSRALWCGSPEMWEDQPVECGTWSSAPGYGNRWNCIVQLALPSSFSVANGCTLWFDPRYDLECKYDYFYVDYLSVGPSPTYTQTWKTLATFNATSSNPGAACGGVSPNPDYYGNTDVNRLVNCNWQNTSVPGMPAYKGVITHAMLGTRVSAPNLRWRVVSDGSMSDTDGRIDTDGGAFIDRVMLFGDAGSFYYQDFETCAVYGALPQYWTLETPPGVLDAWHIQHDPDPPYEGGDGGTRSTCLLDSSYVWRARPVNGYPAGVAWRSGWYYRLMSPRIPIANTGCVVQYDDFQCYTDVTCDFTDVRVRFYDTEYGRWCPWVRVHDITLEPSCAFWGIDNDEDVSALYGAAADSMQFGWEMLDAGVPGMTCYGKHTGSEFQVDNVSVGFYDGGATDFAARGADLLHDTFTTGICGFNSFFDVYSADTVAKYSGPGAPPLPKEQQLYVDVTDKDGLVLVEIRGSIDGGSIWVTKTMTLAVPADPGNPSLGGEYYGTLCPADFALTQWAAGTEVWYYVKATDELASQQYFPTSADPTRYGHTGSGEDYLEFTVLPNFPPEYAGPRILLVSGDSRRCNDYAPCLSVTDEEVRLESIYEAALEDAGYCFDRFDIAGAGMGTQIQPVDYDDYDAVIWFTGPYFSTGLFSGRTQRSIRAFLADSGKVVLCGDRIAYDLAPEAYGEDSLGGEFLGGVLGADYLSEMPSGWTYPYAYSVAVESLDVLGRHVAVDLDSILVYRGCPYLKDMSYVLTSAAPPAGYSAQRLMYVANPTVAQADEAIYVEYQDGGQCVFVNFDLSASVNHERGYCGGDAADPAPDFAAGTYDGRVELMRVILEDIFGLPSGSGGQAGVPAEPGLGPDGKQPAYQWALHSTSPNPAAGSAAIRYSVASPGRVRLLVYSATGQMVRTLADGWKEPGEYSAAWDGRSVQGEPVSSGIYFCKMEGLGFRATQKLVVMR